MKPAYRPSTQPSALQRRTLLGVLGAAGSAAAAGLVAARRPGDEPGAAAPAAPGADPPRGYHLSEHVQRYYRSARS